MVSWKTAASGRQECDSNAGDSRRDSSLELPGCSQSCAIVLPFCFPFVLISPLLLPPTLLFFPRHPPSFHPPFLHSQDVFVAVRTVSKERGKRCADLILQEKNTRTRPLLDAHLEGADVEN
eukprot:750130-Hanusia_phi.AAC.9